MTVNELIERLKQYDASAKVYFAYFNDDDDDNVITFETDEVGIIGNNDHIVIDLLNPEPYKKMR